MPIPKPALAFVVGVTGHRSARLKDQHRDRIAQQLSDVFRNIEKECQAQLDRHIEFYAETKPRLRMISSLSDGADAMAVRQCPATWTITGLLPLPETEYIDTLRSTAPAGHGEKAVAEYAAARREAKQTTILPQSRPQDTRGLARSRDLLLRQIDVLVAVWDGGPAKHAGGTADTIDRAAEAGIPIIWIAAEKSQKPWVISHIEDASRETPMADATSGPIADIVRSELGISERRGPVRQPWDVDSHGLDAAIRLNEFLNEAVPASSEKVTPPWISFLAALPEQGGFSKRMEHILLPRFVAADALATHYGKRYRMAYVCAYLLSAFAVAAALTSFVLYGGEHQAVPIGEAHLAAIEFFFIALIVAIVWRGQHKRWHDRWLDYRALAETLRHLRFLGPLGQYEKRAYLEAAARPGAGWMLWYFRATMRELGMPSGDLGPDYQRKVLTATVPAELEAQIGYHADNLKTLRRVHRGLHWLGNFCFAGALVVLVLFLAALSISEYVPALATKLANHAPKVTAITAFLPALGAAFAGIRFTGDFEGFAERSAQTGAQLDLLRQRYDLAMDRLDFDTSAGVVFESARIMAADINGWTSLYSRKHLSLPG
jgi:hypothetical protein